MPSLLLALALAALATAVPFTPSPLHDRSSARRTPGTLPVTSHVVELARSVGSGKTSSALLYQELIANGSRVGTGELDNFLFSTEFIANVTFGQQTFLAIIDTGSSDTWLVETGFTCVNQTNNETVPVADCDFGPTYTPDSSFTQIPDENFNISYADGEYLNGIMGYDSVTFGGINVPKQEVALATLAAWDGDTVSSGLVGLAFSSITSAYTGTDASADIPQGPNATDPATNNIPYSEIIHTIFFVDNITEPLFSLALSRDESQNATTALGYGGVIAIGGVPDYSLPTINATGTFVSTPIQMLKLQFINPQTPQYQFYTITVGGFTAGGLHDSRSVQYIVDSGTTLLYVPTADAARANAGFEPPAINSAEFGAYIVACDAKPPKVAFSIAGESFSINPYDLVQNEEIGDNICLSGIQDGGPVEDGSFILGDVFLNNVLAVFDQGALEMHFSAREYYDS